MQADNPLRHTKHIFRILLLLILSIVAIILGRSFFVPASFGDHGYYRHDNVAQQMDKPVQHGGDDSCASCHEEQHSTHADGEHASVRCEVCHAPVSVHAAGNKKTAPMPKRRSKDMCLRCHRQLDARPDDFPQIQPRQHVDENGGDWADDVCFECHSAHSPL